MRPAHRSEVDYGIFAVYCQCCWTVAVAAAGELCQDQGFEVFGCYVGFVIGFADSLAELVTFGDGVVVVAYNHVGGGLDSDIAYVRRVEGSLELLRFGYFAVPAVHAIILLESEIRIVGYESYQSAKIVTSQGKQPATAGEVLFNGAAFGPGEILGV